MWRLRHLSHGSAAGCCVSWASSGWLAPQLCCHASGLPRRLRHPKRQPSCRRRLSQVLTVHSKAMVLVSGMEQWARTLPLTLPVSFHSQKPKPWPTEEHLLKVLHLLNPLHLLSLVPGPGSLGLMVLSRAMVLASGMDPQAPPLQRTLRTSSLMRMHQDKTKPTSHQPSLSCR